MHASAAGRWRVHRQQCRTLPDGPPAAGGAWGGPPPHVFGGLQRQNHRHRSVGPPGPARGSREDRSGREGDFLTRPRRARSLVLPSSAAYTPRGSKATPRRGPPAQRRRPLDLGTATRRKRRATSRRPRGRAGAAACSRPSGSPRGTPPRSGWPKPCPQGGPPHLPLIRNRPRTWHARMKRQNPPSYLRNPPRVHRWAAVRRRQAAAQAAKEGPGGRPLLHRVTLAALATVGVPPAPAG